MHLKNLEEDLLDRINRAVAPELDRLRRKSVGEPPYDRHNQPRADHAAAAGESESELMCDVTSSAHA